MSQNLHLNVLKVYEDGSEGDLLRGEPDYFGIRSKSGLL
jgi:hypothetical protein